MKYILNSAKYTFTVILASILAMGCSNEIDLFEEGDTIPVVYCLLNPQEDVQYLRLAKIYTVTKETYQNNPVPDSTQLSEPSLIYIEEYDENDDVEEIYYFSQTDFPERGSGLFSDHSYSLYKAEFKPVEGKTYVLYVYFPDQDKIISGKTVVMDIPELIDPMDVPFRMITFDSLSNLVIRWTPVQNGGLYQGVFRFHYAEQSGGNTDNKFVDFATPLFSGLDVALQIHSTGSRSGDFPSIFEFTNLIGGVGIFSSFVSFRIPNLKLSPVSIRNLQTHPLTRDLGFEIIMPTP
ncbi:MAG: hypothetical protein U9N86_13735 [Bacteroidota bacterium]|nr:hypothetical protein [Bacteroidota bacterium]